MIIVLSNGKRFLVTLIEANNIIQALNNGSIAELTRETIQPYLIY